jgi:hypothetical protein
MTGSCIFLRAYVRPTHIHVRSFTHIAAYLSMHVYMSIHLTVLGMYKLRIVAHNYVHVYVT